MTAGGGKARFWIWCAIGVCIAGAAAIKHWENRKWQTIQNNWNPANGPDPWSPLLEAMIDQPKEKVIARINSQATVQWDKGSQKMGVLETVTFDDPASKWKVSITFISGIFKGGWTETGPMNFASPVPPGDYVKGEEIRVEIYAWALWVSVAAMAITVVLGILWLSNGRKIFGVWARPAAELALAAALVGVAAYALNIESEFAFRERGLRSDGFLQGHAWLIVTSVLLLFFLPRASALRRPQDCPRCGYDLTGNASGVCSECGAPVHSRIASIS